MKSIFKRDLPSLYCNTIIYDNILSITYTKTILKIFKYKKPIYIRSINILYRNNIKFGDCIIINKLLRIFVFMNLNYRNLIINEKYF